jgi:diguanylate cyclase (GGDEF)-like protein/putative nucleotidyltransferase with HDIG domain
LKFSQDISDIKSEVTNGRVQSNPIQNAVSPFKSVSKIENHRKTSNKLYGGYNHSQKFFSYQHSADAIETLYEFCSSAKCKENLEEVFYSLHNLTMGKLGFNFTAIGLINSQSNCINIKLLDRIGNAYSSRALLSETQNPIVRSFIDKIPQNITNTDFLNISYLNKSQAVVFPMIFHGECVGMLMAGYNELNQQNMDILNILVDYLTLYVLNHQLGEKITLHNDVDALTGLKNHRGFQERLSEEITKATQQDIPLSVVIFDVNNISQINRELGHAKGDEIIKVVSEKIKQNIRSVDIAGRYGGDEIAVILPDLDNSEACYIAEYLNYSLSCCLIDDVGPVKVSIGIATYPTCAKEQEKLLILAEQAMIISKNKGYKNGMSTLINAQDINFWNEMALDSFAAVIAKRHSQLGLNFEEELVKKFHNDTNNSNNHMIDVVTSLAGAIDAKDPYTRGHSQSVSRYAESLARAVNLPESEVERIKLGALLHDVGKIGIPESVLKKPDKLEDDEWEIMKQHPVIGAKKVLEPIESLRDLIPMVKHHHEHWDGSGYPNNLKGEQIPFAARIVAIADSFHALISDRPYRKGLALDKALEILCIGAGIQWDKDLVRKFIIIAPSLSTSI